MVRRTVTRPSGQREGECTHWWRPGRSEQLHAEAGSDRVLTERAPVEAAESARYAADLKRELGAPHLRQARQQLERAEVSCRSQCVR